MNRTPGNSVVKMADPEAGSTRWELAYEGLTDDEISSLRRSVRRLRRTVTNLYVRRPLWKPIALDRGLIEASVGVVDADRAFE